MLRFSKVRQGELAEGMTMAELFDSKLSEMSNEEVNSEEHHRVKEFDQRLEDVSNAGEYEVHHDKSVDHSIL